MKKYIIIISLFFLIIQNNIYCLSPKTNINKAVFLEYFNSFENIYSIWHYTDNIQTLFHNSNIKITDDAMLWVHIWQTIKNIDDFKIDEIQKRDLRLIMFFHDLGKIYGWKNHEFRSAAICCEILSKLDFNNDYILFICKMIEYHSDFGVYPNISHDLTNLNKTEIETLYFVSMADIKTRKEFDTPQNLNKFKKLKNLLLTNNTNDLEVFKNRLKLIFDGIKSFHLYRQLNVFKLNMYGLKDFFYFFVKDNKELDINSIKSILNAV